MQIVYLAERHFIPSEPPLLARFRGRATAARNALRGAALRIIRSTIAKWVRADMLPQRNATAPKTTSPRYFEEYLSGGWSERCARGRHLFQEIKARGYTGSF